MNYKIVATDKSLLDEIRKKIDNLNKPKGSLGRLETLAEQMGYEELNEEVSKYSEYFVTHFAR